MIRNNPVLAHAIIAADDQARQQGARNVAYIAAQIPFDDLTQGLAFSDSPGNYTLNVSISNGHLQNATGNALLQTLAQDGKAVMASYSAAYTVSNSILSFANPEGVRAWVSAVSSTNASYAQISVPDMAVVTTSSGDSSFYATSSFSSRTLNQRGITYTASATSGAAANCRGCQTP